MSFTYGSVCSGIESATVAWHPLGAKPLWFSEVEPFPSAVLSHRWPSVPNLGDMCALADGVRTGFVPAPDVLVGGTPCQAFSVAGKGKSLSDSRGQLTLEYVRLLNEIDKQREQPAVCVWENVPGVLSTKDNAFGCFLGELAGSGCELRAPNGGKWGNAGIIAGPQRAIAWRVLDAQYFGLAQRRKRVFVVASARDGFDPGQVLFEFEGVRRDIAPSREAGQDAPQGARDGFALSGFGEWRDGVGTLRAAGGDHGGGSEMLCVHATQDPCVTSEVAGSLGTSARFAVMDTFYSVQGHGDYKENTVAACLKSRDYKGVAGGLVLPITDKATRHAGKTGRGSGNGLGVGQPTDPAPTLTAGDWHAVNYGRVARKLMPVECERLQGFPDNHTMIPWRGKAAEDCPDGPRMKAIGNSKAVDVVRWIGQRLLNAI